MLAKIGHFILDYLIERLQSWLSALLRVKNKGKVQESEVVKKAEEYQKVIDNPNATREERRRATDKFLNS